MHASQKAALVHVLVVLKAHVQLTQTLAKNLAIHVHVQLVTDLLAQVAILRHVVLVALPKI